MDTSPKFLTEKEERAIRRMEQLTELRRSARSHDWHVYFSCLTQLGMPAWFIYVYCSQPITKFTIGMLVFAAAFGSLSLLSILVVNPLRRRIDALTRLLEDEIKRSR